MPSPFPGMDPYLEGPLCFSDFHHAFITYLRAQLTRTLPEPYYAAIGERTWVEYGNQHLPDVGVLREEVPTPAASQGGLAAAVEAEVEAVVITVPSLEVSEGYIEVYTRRGDDERLVTAIELLSPTNKTPGDRGRAEYARKQSEVLRMQAHLVEIDLLRGGTHSTAVPLADLRRRVPAYDYHVCIKPFDAPEDFHIFPLALTRRLPIIPIPLLPGDPPVKLDIQAALNEAYDSAPYRRRVNYAGPVPAPALSPGQEAWLGALLVEKGLRPRPPVISSADASPAPGPASP